MHSSHHTGDEPIDPIALLDERDEGGNLAFVVGRASKMGERQLLERVDLVLERHEIGDCFVSNPTHTHTAI